MNIKSIITAAMALLASTACSGGAKQEKVMKTEGKAIYNPQNEMFASFGTKCTLPQNEKSSQSLI